MTDTGVAAYLDDPECRILTYVRDYAAETGGLPGHAAIADRCGLSVDEVRYHLQAAIESGHMYRVCCGEATGIYVRLPGEADAGRRVTVWAP